MAHKDNSFIQLITLFTKTTHSSNLSANWTGKLKLFAMNTVAACVVFTLLDGMEAQSWMSQTTHSHSGGGILGDQVKRRINMTILSLENNFDIYALQYLLNFIQYA